MRVMILIKSDEATEAGVLPSEQLLADMGKFNEELVKAGVMLAGEGLHASSKGKRVKFSGGKTTVIDGPFTEAKELIAGFWLWQVKSLDEAVEWVKRIPSPPQVDGAPQGEGVIEIRQVFEMDDFGAEFTPELRKQEDDLRKQVAANANRPQ
ncbi:MAG TPA: YciI family protein [Anaerolineae bacterium]